MAAYGSNFTYLLKHIIVNKDRDRYDRPRYNNDRPRDERGGGYDRPRYNNDRPRYNSDREEREVYGEKLRAGKRTYFFDIRPTRNNDFCLTVTESKKRMDDSTERHKIFVYKEDVNKFLASLQSAIDYLKTELMPEYDFDQFSHEEEHEERLMRRNRYADEEQSDNETTEEVAEDSGTGEEFVNELADEQDNSSDDEKTEDKDGELTWD